MTRAQPVNQRGFLLITVIVILGTLAAIALMLSTSTSMDALLVTKHTDKVTLEYLAEAGAVHASWLLTQSENCSDYESVPETDFGVGRYSAKVSPASGSPVRITGIGKLADGATNQAVIDDVIVYDHSSLRSLVLEPGAEGKDTFIEGDSGHHDHNKGDDKDIRTSSKAGKEYRTLIQFDLSALPSSIRVESAILEIELSNLGSADSVEAHRLLHDWDEMEATWNNADTGNTWESPGGDYEPEPVAAFIPNTTGPQSMDITSVTAAWVKGTWPNYGLILRSPSNSNGQENEYHSSDSSNGPRPKLTITYACECGGNCTDMVGMTLPIAHWKLDDATGFTAVDSIGGHNGTLENGPVWSTSGQIDGALRFDGLNDRVIVPHDDTLSLTSAFTISAWIKNESPTMSGTHRILSKESSGTNDNYWLSEQNGQLWFGVGGQFFSPGGSMALGQWYHVAASFDSAAGEVRMYIDGTELLTQSTSVSLTSNTDSIYIGANWQGEKYWDGLLDDVRLYDTALSSEVVAEVAASAPVGGSGGDPPENTYRDEFNSRSYSGSDGSLTWSTDWLEIGESDGPTSNDEQVRSDGDFDYVLQLRDNDNGGEGVQREANLSGCSTATLSFDFRRVSFDNSNDYVTISASADGGDSWTELDRFSGPANETTYQHSTVDLSTFMATNTRIRFLTSPTLGGNDRFYTDNIQIACQ